MKIRKINNSGTQIVDKVKKYYEIEKEQFLKYFFDIDEPIEWVNEDEKADICVYSVQLEDDMILRENEVNIFFSIENMNYWGYRGHYKFFNKYESNGSKRTNIYIHNHVSRIIEKQDTITFPTVYFRVNYFNNIKNNYNIEIPWEKKRFCLFISKNFLNKNKEKMVNQLATLGPVHHINDYNVLLSDKSCYNSNEIIKVFSFYKFIICCENSKSNGYVTEKIFNILLAKSVPIYDGAPDIERYINRERYIPYENNMIDRVKVLMNSEELYKKMVNKNEINADYNDENFKEKFKNRLKNNKV
tara:strand:- start:424 stop:1326 length:903 start_codon:yes stop_codon:yes gene_type:complete